MRDRKTGFQPVYRASSLLGGAKRIPRRRTRVPELRTFADGDLKFKSARERPPHSGKMLSFPEADRAELFPLELAPTKLLAGQRPFLSELANLPSQAT